MSDALLDKPSENGLTLRATLAAARAADAIRAKRVPGDGQTDSSLVGVSIVGVDVKIPGRVVDLLLDALDEVAVGGDVVVAPADLRLGTSEVSRLLGVSRPWVSRLIDDGVLAGSKVGSKRRVALHNVLQHRRERRETLRRHVETLDNLSDMGAVEQVTPGADALSSQEFVVPSARHAEVNSPAAEDVALQSAPSQAADGEFALAA